MRDIQTLVTRVIGVFLGMFILIVMGGLLLSAFGVGNDSEENVNTNSTLSSDLNSDLESTATSEDCEKLVVYAVGDRSHFDEEEFYTTLYRLGADMPMAEKWGEEAYIFYDAIQQYEKNTGLEVEVTFFDATADMLECVEREIKEGQGPDVILGSYSYTGYCLYPYINEEYFADLTPYFNEDDLCLSDTYISRILEAGKVGDHQYVFPLTFNMNILFSSEESVQRHDFRLADNMTYKEMLTMFTDGWQQQDRKTNARLMMQYTNMWGDYPCVLFQAASGEKLIDYETGAVQLDQDYFSELARLYESYLCNDYGLTREELKAMAKLNQGFLQTDKSKYSEFLRAGGGPVMDHFDRIKGSVVYIAEGGNCSYETHSFAAQTYYYESKYRDADEEFICIGVPSRMDKESYTAQVTNFGAVLADSEYIKEGYELLKTMADSEHFLCLDLPVNKEITTKTIHQMASTYFSYYVSSGLFPPKIEVPEEEKLAETYQIQPLSEETEAYLLHMIDNIGVANLPEFGVNHVITEEIEAYIYGDTDTIEEAYDKALQRLKEHDFSSY